MAAALAEELRSWTQPVLELLAGTGDPATRLLEAVNTLSETFEQQANRAPGTAGGLRAHGTRSRRRHPGGADLAHPPQHSSRRRSPSCSPTTRFPGWVSPNTMAALILAVGAGTVVHATVDPERVDHRAIAAQFTRLLLASGTRSGSRWFRVRQRPSTRTSPSCPRTARRAQGGAARRPRAPACRIHRGDAVRDDQLVHAARALPRHVQPAGARQSPPSRTRSATCRCTSWASTRTKTTPAGPQRWTETDKRLDMGKSCVRFKQARRPSPRRRGRSHRPHLGRRLHRRLRTVTRRRVVGAALRAASRTTTGGLRRRSRHTPHAVRLVGGLGLDLGARRPSPARSARRHR